MAIKSKALVKIQARREALERMRATIACMKPITYKDGSWTDQQAEDAIVTINTLITMAKSIGPEI